MIDNVEIRFRTLIALKYAILDLQEAQRALEYPGKPLLESLRMVDRVAVTMASVACDLESAKLAGWHV